jgi:hypothetical protein
MSPIFCFVFWNNVTWVAEKDNAEPQFGHWLIIASVCRRLLELSNLSTVRSMQSKCQQYVFITIVSKSKFHLYLLCFLSWLKEQRCTTNGRPLMNQLPVDRNERPQVNQTPEVTRVSQTTVASLVNQAPAANGRHLMSKTPAANGKSVMRQTPAENGRHLVSQTPAANGKTLKRQTSVTNGISLMSQVPAANGKPVVIQIPAPKGRPMMRQKTAESGRTEMNEIPVASGRPHTNKIPIAEV